MMMEKLPDILICVFRYLHDPLFEIPANTILPEPMPFYSDEKQVLETIEYLQVRLPQFVPIPSKPVSNVAEKSLFVSWRVSVN